MTRLPGRRPWRLTIIAAVLFATAGGIAYATIPGSGNVYTACMQKSTGTIRLIDTSLPAKNKRSHCVAAEKSLTWNQVGPTGSAGAGGLPGAKGDVGAQGEQGLPGAKGDTGAAGVGSSVYHASVYSNGFPSNVGNSPEFVGATKLSTGIYNLNFSVDVSQCGRVATLGIPSDQQNSSTFFHGLKGEISTFYDLANNKLAVATFDSAGNPADINFHVVVAC